MKYFERIAFSWNPVKGKVEVNISRLTDAEKMDFNEKWIIYLRFHDAMGRVRPPSDTKQFEHLFHDFFYGRK